MSFFSDTASVRILATAQQCSFILWLKCFKSVDLCDLKCDQIKINRKQLQHREKKKGALSSLLYF